MTRERAATWRSFSFPHQLICGNGFTAIHATEQELWVGFYKKNSGKPSITWPESVDEALCVGWIDGIRKSIDEESYMIRFTPRRRGSVWSAVNIKRVEVLTNEKRMRPPGLAAFAARRREQVGHLFLRTAERAIARAIREPVAKEPESLEVLPGAATILPQDDRLVGGEREAGKDAPEAAAKVDRGICHRPSPVAGALNPVGLAARHVSCGRGQRPRLQAQIRKSSKG